MKNYFIDILFKDWSIAIEYQGTWIHGNPSWSEEEKKCWKYPFNNQKSLKEVLEYDNKKFKFLNKKFRKVFVYYNDEDRSEKINEIVNYFIKERNNNVS